MPSQVARRSSAAALALLAAGCASEPLKLEVSEDWSVRNGQAVWTPKGAAAGIAGELLMATNHTGGSLVEFAKPPITIAVARRIGLSWDVEFPAEQKRFSGRGQPPQGIVWLNLVDSLRGMQSTWTVTQTNGAWRMERDGESLEGFLAP